jgi:MFS family permease
MVAYRALDLGASPAEVGVIAASFAILAVIVALPAGAWADRVGGEIVAVLGTVLMAISAVGLAVVDSLLLLGVAYMCAGLAQTVTLIAQQAIVGNTGGRAGRDERYGVYASAASLGQLVGPTLAGALAGGAMLGTAGSQGGSNNEAPVFVLAAICCAVATGIGFPAARRSRASGRPSGATPPAPVLSAAASVVRRPGMLRALVVSTMTVASIDMLIAYLPVYGEENALPVELVGFLLSLRAGSTLVSRVLLRQGLRRLGRRVLLAIGLCVACVSIGLVPLTARADILVGLMVAFGLGIGVSQPITVGWVADSSPRHERATAISIRLTANRLSLLTVPLLMGSIAGAAGVGMIFVALAALLAVGAGTAGTSTFASANRTADPSPGPAGASPPSPGASPSSPGASPPSPDVTP